MAVGVNGSKCQCTSTLESTTTKTETEINTEKL
jgi:hypothetical protein